MCFAPQLRALFWHRNFEKWSGAGVFCAFWLGNVLRATTACNFSSLIWPDGSAPAALASLLFDPLEPQIIGKTQCFATLIPFRAPASSFFWLFLFSDFSLLLFSLLLFSSLFFCSTPAFHLSILSEVWLLNFLREYYRIIYFYIPWISINLILWYMVWTQVALKRWLTSLCIDCQPMIQCSWFRSESSTTHMFSHILTLNKQHTMPVHRTHSSTQLPRQHAQTHCISKDNTP